LEGFVTLSTELTKLLCF